MTILATEVPIELEKDPFVHPNGLFRLHPPKGWKPAQAETDKAIFQSPDGKQRLEVQVTNTGLALDSASFSRFVEGREANLFGREGVSAAWQETGREMDVEAGTAQVTKTLATEESLQAAITRYKTSEAFILSLDLWTSPAGVKAQADSLNGIWESLTIDPAVANNLSLYQHTITISGPDGLYTLQVPVSWGRQSTRSLYTYVETFTSPDERAVLQCMNYDDGDAVSRTLAGSLARNLLRNYYSENIKVFEDYLLGNGSERLIWQIPGENILGTSQFNSHGSTFVMVNGLVEETSEDLYGEVIERILNSYTMKTGP